MKTITLQEEDKNNGKFTMEISFLEGEEWGIAYWRSIDKFFVMHSRCKDYRDEETAIPKGPLNYNRYYTNQNEKKCWVCGEKFPEEISTLFKLLTVEID